MNRTLLLACLFSTFASAQAVLPSELPSELVARAERGPGRHGVAGAALEAAVADRRVAEMLDRDAADAKWVGADGTPTGFVNGRKINGAQPLEAFQKLIDEELSDASPSKLGK